MMNQTALKPSSVKVAPVLGIWLAATILVSASGILYDPPRPLLPLLIWTPVLAFLVSFATSHSLRRWALSLNLRWPIAFHVVRLPIGVAFLLMEAGDRLPAEFAVKGGIGDITIGATAIVALLCVPLLATFRIRIVLVWNILGLADILMVFAVAQKLLFVSGTPNALVELTRFPFLVVPAFVVPIVLITHFIVFAQIWSNRTARGHRGI